MLPIDVTGSSVDSTLGSTATKDDLGREDFLRMLVAQLENQDPLNPQDGTEFTAQLAQFSSLEQLIAMRSSIDALTRAETDARSTTETLAAAGLIGRQVLAESDIFQVPADGRVPSLAVELAGPADRVSVKVVDPNDVEVTTLEIESPVAGRNEIEWDGLDGQGEALPAGLYRLEVTPYREDLLPVAATPLVSARVTGADLSAGEPRLQLGPLVVPLAGVREVREAEGDQ